MRRRRGLERGKKKLSFLNSFHRLRPLTTREPDEYNPA